MRSAETILGIIQERGKQGLPLERVFRLLFNRDLYLMAYGKIYRNNGATTPGSTPETVDEMSLRKIDSIIDAVRRNGIGGHRRGESTSRKRTRRRSAPFRCPHGRTSCFRKSSD